MESERVNSVADWKKVAVRFLESHPQGGVFGLIGEMGAGKTSFVRAFVHEISEREGVRPPRVISPSYVLHQCYDTTPSIDHFDLYRLSPLDVSQLWELGYSEALSRAERGGFVFVEWPDRLPGEYRCPNTMEITWDPPGRRIRCSRAEAP